MKIKELRAKNNQELELSLKELREKSRKLKFDLAEKKLKNVGEISLTKKSIAQILTVLKQKHEQNH